MNTLYLKAEDDGTVETAARLIREGKLAAVPGSCFGVEGFLRLTYCYEDAELKKGLDRLEAFLATL